MIDLGDPEAICPGLPPASAAPLAHRAIVALERHHRSPALLAVTGEGDATTHEVVWTTPSQDLGPFEDHNEATRDGAMGIALAVAHRQRGWRVIRRLQSTQSEGADWLFADPGMLFVLEVKGTDHGALPLAEAWRQAQASIWAKRATPAVCVVRFAEPRAIFQTYGPR